LKSINAGTPRDEVTWYKKKEREKG
jgi:hypothetical protein